MPIYLHSNVSTEIMSCWWQINDRSIAKNPRVNKVWWWWWWRGRNGGCNPLSTRSLPSPSPTSPHPRLESLFTGYSLQLPFSGYANHPDLPAFVQLYNSYVSVRRKCEQIALQDGVEQGKTYLVNSHQNNYSRTIQVNQYKVQSIYHIRVWSSLCSDPDIGRKKPDD